MDRWKGKVAIVTEAISGIGSATVESLVDQGLQVVGFGRQPERIENLAKKFQDQKKTGTLYSLDVDITNEQDIVESFKWVLDNIGPVHILINNAGTIQDTTLINGDTSKWKTVFDSNVLALCIATREAVKIMRNHNIDGHIIHINSIAGHTVIPFPNTNVFSASKYAVTALTETLRQEFNHYGLKIKISSISPGAIFTEVILASHRNTLNSKLGEIIKKMPMLASKDIAEAILFVLSTPPHVQIHEIVIRALGDPI